MAILNIGQYIHDSVLDIILVIVLANKRVPLIVFIYKRCSLPVQTGNFNFVLFGVKKLFTQFIHFDHQLVKKFNHVDYALCLDPIFYMLMVYKQLA